MLILRGEARSFEFVSLLDSIDPETATRPTSQAIFGLTTNSKLINTSLGGVLNHTSLVTLSTHFDRHNRVVFSQDCRFCSDMSCAAATITLLFSARLKVPT